MLCTSAIEPPTVAMCSLMQSNAIYWLTEHNGRQTHRLAGKSICTMI